MHTLTVDKNEAGKRLDLFLALQLPQYSRSNVRKLLDAGKVKRGDETEYRPNYKVVAGDKFSVTAEVEMQRKQFEAYAIPIEVLYQQGGLLVVNKPVGISVHPVNHSDSKSMLNAVVNYLGPNLDENYGVTPINRIDKQTSGIVLYATAPEAGWYYSRQFADSQVAKEYLAVVYGRWGAKFGKREQLVSNFLRDDHLHSKRKVDTSEGEFAETAFSLLSYDKKRNFSLLRVRPRTGRKHQIRAQLEHMGFPIIGDMRYNGRKHQRMLLHAWKVEIPQLGSDGTIKLEAAPDKHFQDLLG